MTKVSSLAIVCIVSSTAIPGRADEATVATWFHTHTKLWRVLGRDPFPVKRIFKDFQHLGVNELYYMHQRGRGGPFYHPSKVQYATRPPDMPRNRDFLRDVLTEADRYDMKVWLTWTTPAGVYPGTEFRGLNHPGVQQIYKNVIDEIAREYGQHKSLVGFHWHEVNNTTNVDTHSDDIPDFSEFCRSRFDEAYTGTAMPETDPTDKWWRRHLLYRNHVLSSFMKEMAEHARRHKLRTYFCYYFPELSRSASWRWGQDAIALERIVDVFRLSPLPGGRPYLSFKRGVVDFAPGYPHQVLPRNYSYAIHGRGVCYFSSFYPVYVEETRKRYSALKSWTAQYGDFYTGHYGQSEAAVKLFYGKENMRNWIQLMRRWQPGEGAANTAVAVNPVPYMMLHPQGPGITFTPDVSALMDSLAEHVDVDAMVTGSLAMDANLKRYRLIILPTGMATGLDPASYGRYRDYVRGGGTLLVINTPVSTSREDLTQMVDRTAELCGVRFLGHDVPGHVTLASKGPGPALPKKECWTRTGKIELAGAQVMVTRKDTGAPLLTRRAVGKGAAYFSACSFAPHLTEYFASLVSSIAPPPIGLKGSRGIRILEATRKGNAVAVPLWGRGRAVFRVDAGALGLKGEVFQVQDAVTGTVLADRLSAASLAAGVPVEIKYAEQPFILVAGASADVADCEGLYPSFEVFRDLGKKAAARKLIENPEVPIMVPEGKGLKVGVYHRGYGATSLTSVLEREDFRVFPMLRLTHSALRHADVVIVPQVRGNRKFFSQSTDQIRKYVETGGGVLLLHDAVGFRGHPPVFPEVGKGTLNVYRDTAVVTGAHRITEGLKKGEPFVHCYFDHITMEKGPAGEVLVEDEKGKAVMLAGPVGEGRVVLLGVLSGWDLKVRGDRTAGDGPAEPKGAERQLILNAVRWLGSKASAGAGQ